MLSIIGKTLLRTSSQCGVWFAVCRSVSGQLQGQEQNKRRATGMFAAAIYSVQALLCAIFYCCRARRDSPQASTISTGRVAAQLTAGTTDANLCFTISQPLNVRRCVCVLLIVGTGYNHSFICIALCIGNGYACNWIVGKG